MRGLSLARAHPIAAAVADHGCRGQRPRLQKRASAAAEAVKACVRVLAASALFSAAAFADPPPSFWDPALHLEKPDISGVRAIRFLTADDYPPLDFSRGDGELSGFNVEIARAICEELHIGCTIQARRFDTLVDALESGKGDALIASLATTPALRDHLDFTMPYYSTPARFAARKDSPLSDVTPFTLNGRNIGVITGSAHEAYLKAFFPGARLSPYPNFAALHEALVARSVDAIFGDGLTIAVWLAGENAADCCAFKGGPFTESRFFGEGVSIAVRKEDSALRRAIDWALARIAQHGAYAEIYRKYFPIGFY
jgi:polar amino acid transport system substrate-binding protein